MLRKWTFLLVLILLLTVSFGSLAQDDEITVGVILVGPATDQGWSQAHAEGIEYVVEKMAEEGVTVNVLTFESLNPGDSPEATVLSVTENMVDEGAEIIFTTSDEFELETVAAALEFPDVKFVHISGSATLGRTPSEFFPGYYEATEPEEAPENFLNVMGQMEFGKAIAGCAAALATETGQIGYLGPLINAETRRYVSATYLGADYCYKNYRGMEEDLGFRVVWIGFWIPIPGFTLDPTQVANNFFDTGSDVVISGIDPQDALVVAGQRQAEGDNVFAVPYDYEGACNTAPDACLGIPYFHWGPSYLGIVASVLDGSFESDWLFPGPDWDDINNPDTTTVGWLNGSALTEEQAVLLAEFIAEMTAFQTDPENEGLFFLWEGPLSFQDGTVLAEEGEFVDPLAVWYLPYLLEGIQGDSVLSN